MSFVRKPEKLLNKYPQYRAIARQRTFTEVHKNFCELLRDHFDEKAIVKVKRTSLKQIAKNMELCDGNGPSAYNIEQSLDDKFYVMDGPDEDTSIISRKFKKDALKPYIENRYWKVKTNMEFCISAGIGYEDAKFFSANMMGIPWLYLRNTEYLIGDFCLRFSLGPKAYRRIHEYVTSMKNSSEVHVTESTVTFVKHYESFCAGIERVLGNRPMDEETIDNLCRDFEWFIIHKQEYLSGNYQRAFRYMKKISEEPEKELPYVTKYIGIKRAALVRQFLKTTLPWETRSDPKEADSEDKIRKMFIAIPNQEPAIRKRLESYGKNERDISDVSYLLVRSDLIRLLLMNGFSDIEELNRILESYSFFPLNEGVPFDFLVLSALFIGTGAEINDYEKESDPYEALSLAAKIFS